MPLVPKKTPVSETSGGSVAREADPFLSNEKYEHVRSVLSSVSLSMERSPSRVTLSPDETARLESVSRVSPACWRRARLALVMRLRIGTEGT